MKYFWTGISLFLSVALTAQASWELVKEEKDIQVYVKKEADSQTKQVKIEATIACQLSELVTVLEDVEGQTTWVESTIEAKILDKNASNNFVFYLSTDMPYPVSDRDVVLAYNRQQDPLTKAVSINFDHVDGRLESQKGFVRMPLLSSSYRLQPDGNGTVALTYNLSVDVGGTMPKWVVNMAITKGPIDTIKSLFEQIRTGRYRGVVVEGVVD